MSDTSSSPVRYKAPKLTHYGSLRDITRGGSDGSHLDATFTVGTAFSDLTFS